MEVISSEARWDLEKLYGRDSWKSIHVNAEFFETVPESVPADAEKRCRLALVTAREPDSRPDVFLLHGLEGKS